MYNDSMIYDENKKQYVYENPVAVKKFGDLVAKSFVDNLNKNNAGEPNPSNKVRKSRLGK